MNKEDIYKEKNNNYYSLIRHDLIQMIEGNGNKILDVGCGEGQTGWFLKKSGKAREVVGIELNEDAAKRAEGRLDKVIHGDVEKLALPFQTGYFDYIIFGDVLEHLSDPWNTLKRLKRHLSSSGFAVASIPNIAYWEILKDLIFFDKWAYIDAGILDRTHLRFFTEKSLIDLFEGSGFEIKELIHHIPPRFINKIGNLVTLGSLKRFFTAGYFIKARIK